MHPVVNVVDNSHSRIRTLEQEVLKLRGELSRKERPPPPSPAAEVPHVESADSMQERLHAQLQENEKLIRGREALARCGAARILKQLSHHAVVSLSPAHDRTSLCGRIRIQLGDACKRAGRSQAWSGWCSTQTKRGGPAPRRAPWTWTISPPPPPRRYTRRRPPTVQLRARRGATTRSRSRCRRSTGTLCARCSCRAVEAAGRAPRGVPTRAARRPCAGSPWGQSEGRTRSGQARRRRARTAERTPTRARPAACSCSTGLIAPDVRDRLSALDGRAATPPLPQSQARSNASGWIKAVQEHDLQEMAEHDDGDENDDDRGADAVERRQ